MSKLKNPMQFSLSNRTVDVENWLQPTEEEPSEKKVTSSSSREDEYSESDSKNPRTDIDIRPGEGSIYVHWTKVES